jgi:hypothetical protein
MPVDSRYDIAGRLSPEERKRIMSMSLIVGVITGGLSWVSLLVFQVLHLPALVVLIYLPVTMFLCYIPVYVAMAVKVIDHIDNFSVQEGSIVEGSTVIE